jgi:hypothetical protein
MSPSCAHGVATGLRLHVFKCRANVFRFGKRPAVNEIGTIASQYQQLMKSPVVLLFAMFTPSIMFLNPLVDHVSELTFSASIENVHVFVDHAGDTHSDTVIEDAVSNEFRVDRVTCGTFARVDIHRSH